MSRHLDALWEQALPEDITEGKEAYARYHKTLQRFALYYKFGIVPVVEAFAALSPNNDYHGNLRSLASVLQHVKEGCGRPYTVSTYKACGKRAVSYLTGEVSFLDTVKGLKTRAFRHNLLYPETSREVTVDGHMYAAFVGQQLTMKEAALLFGRSPKKYHEVAEAIVKLARGKHMSPCQCQAVLWITRKRVNSIKFAAQYDLFADATDLGKAAASPQQLLPYQPKEPHDA